MSTSTDVKIEYVHRFEYRTQREDGTWTDPEIRYSNPTSSLEQAQKRHEECKDMQYSFGRKFEGIYGYSWKNCQLVKRTTRVTVEEEPV